MAVLLAVLSCLLSVPGSLSSRLEHRVFSLCSIPAALGMRWEGLSSLMKPSVIKNAKRANAKGVTGNMKGEGRLLGGLLVVGGEGQPGIAFEHREAVSSTIGISTFVAQDFIRLFIKCVCCS